MNRSFRCGALPALLVFLSLTNCGQSAMPDSGGPPQCTPGMSIACACDDGHMSAQVCLANGTFGACHCDGTDAGSMDVADVTPVGSDIVDGALGVDSSSEADAPSPLDVFDGASDTDAVDATPDLDAPAMDEPALDAPAMPDAPTATNAACAAATPVTDGTRLIDQDLATAQEDFTCGTVVAHHVLYYTAVIPPGKTLIVSTVGKGPVWWTPTIQLFAMCGATRCVDSQTSRVILPNTTSAAVTEVFAIGSNDPEFLGTFDLAVDIVSPPDNAMCANATTVTDGTVLRREDIGASPYLGGTSMSCGIVVNPRYYRATIPVGYRLAVTVTPTERVWNPSVYIYGDCTFATCYAETDGNFAPNQTLPGVPDRLFIGNGTGTAPVNVIIAVDRAGGGRTGTYDLEVSIEPVNAMPTCATARTVTDGTVLLGEFTYSRTGLCDDFSFTTAPHSNFYRATVPAGQQLVATAFERGGTTPYLYVADSCGPMTACLASAQPGGQTDPAQVIWANTSTSPRDVILQAFGEGGNAAYDLYVSFMPVPEYVESTTPTACDDMTNALQLADLSDNTVPALMPRLPFDFTYFGETIHYLDAESVCAMKLLGDVAIPSNVYSYSKPIPSPESPNDLVAVFWGGASAYPMSNFMHSTSHGQTFGTAPNRHYTVEWSDMYIPSVSGGRVRVQAKLFEGSNRLEFHYCELSPSTAPQATGSTATVGFENATGSRAVLHSRNTAGSVSSATALVYTPR